LLNKRQHFFSVKSIATFLVLTRDFFDLRTIDVTIIPPKYIINKLIIFTIYIYINFNKIFRKINIDIYYITINLIWRNKYDNYYF